ncbi:Hypothetical predicted protein [Cloeon dipterum]|uniref:Protein sleepless n=1 Tax=Cloeon dipterum TaxID=197152 RepID=A0A8S1DEA9_9INSE|nr:Hypothetical predicted protein [Cloeon dipterum]
MRNWIGICVFFLLCLQKGFSLDCYDCTDSPECSDPFVQQNVNQNVTGQICFKAIATISSGYNVDEIFRRGAKDDTPDACNKIKEEFLKDGYLMSYCTTCGDADLCNSSPAQVAVAFFIFLMSTILILL